MNDVNSAVTPRRLTLMARLKSFGYALQGIAFMLKTQHNAWLHGVATIAVIALAVYCDVSASDWRWLIVAMGMVWVGETINTAVEYVCDVVSPDYNHAVKHAKDIAAGGVLIAAVASLVIGVLTFWPYFS
ncbi:MAG: diacylglycerol kinase family protein [Telluria sp.]